MSGITTKEQYQNKNMLRTYIMDRFQVGEYVWIDSQYLGWRREMGQKKAFRIAAFYPNFVMLETEEGYRCCMSYDHIEKYARRSKGVSRERKSCFKRNHKIHINKR